MVEKITSAKKCRLDTMILLFTSAITSAFAECRRELESLGKKRKRNEGTSCQCNWKVRKIRKTDASKDQQDRDEPINEENDKEIAGNGDKVDEEISKNSQLIFKGSALLHKVFWFGKTFGDTIRAYRFCVKTSFAVCTFGFNEY